MASTQTNGSEFINHHLFDHCQTNKITFTRSRAGNSNDGAHVEQKNWSHVRTLVGYLRYDSADELDLLNAIWELDARFTNFLSAQQSWYPNAGRTESDQTLRPATTPH
ncbi:MAG: hypothetical protein O3C27_08430 [Actinomycetota bacterium]|nr:hypothetical protein [Actinomycetota bacterium]